MWTKEKVEELLDTNGVSWDEVVEVLRHIGYIRVPVDYAIEEQLVLDFLEFDDE